MTETRIIKTSRVECAIVDTGESRKGRRIEKERKHCILKVILTKIN